MPKQRRGTPRPDRPRPADPAVTFDSPRPVERERAAATVQAAPAPRPGHVEAVALYEEAIAALQGHEYARAATTLRAVLVRFPEERELHERVRLYLNVCERHMTPRALAPSTPDERTFAATLAVNAGKFEEALEHLRIATTESPEHDHALYMLASVLVLRDELEEAVPLLLRAIELNPDNRALARHDPDLEGLRQFDSVRTVLDAPAPPRIERRVKPARRR